MKRRLQRIQRMAVVVVAACVTATASVGARAADDGAPPAASPVKVTASKEGQTITVNASFDVAAPIKQAWDVLIDYERMPTFLHNLETSKIVKRSGNTLEVTQKGKETFGLLSFSFDNLREVELVPFSEIKSHLIKGTMQKSDGETRLAEKDGVTRVTYHGVFVPNVNLPGALGVPAIESATRKQFEALRGEIERAGGGRKP